jgi:hypothetical protein
MAKTKIAIAGPHLVRYGIAGDQKYLVGDLLHTYDELVINARMVAHMAAGLALFLTQRAHNKAYFIDPETHIFQHDLDYLQSTSEQSGTRLKRSVDRLIEWYGNPVEQVVKKEEQSILPEDFKDDADRREFCRRVIEFQLNAISQRVQDTENVEYYEFLKEKGVVASSSFTPTLVVAPYFCMDGNTVDDWIDVNIACAEDSRGIAAQLGVSLGVQIVITESVLSDKNQIDRLVQKYMVLKPDVFLVWVDALSEQEVSEGLLDAFVSMLGKLRKSGSQVVNLYGSYFSVLLLHRNILDGVTHGLEYGEERPLVPVGGGIPTAKFYLPSLHLRLRREDAIRAVRALHGFDSVTSFHKNVCNCPQCMKTIARDPKADFGNYLRTKRVNNRNIPYPETKDNSVRHYMLCKQREFESPSSDADLEVLRDTGSRLRRFVGAENTDHCRKWADVISRLAK